MKNYIVSEITHYCNITVNKCVEIKKRKIDFYDLTFVLSGSMTYIPEFNLSLEPYIPNCISSYIKRLVSVFPHNHLSSYYHSTEKVANMLNYILFELFDVIAQNATMSMCLNNPVY